LDAVLVNGFNLKAIDSLTFTGGIATATISSGHLYQVDQVLLLSGAEQPQYNGELRVLSTTATTFTFAVDGTPQSPATTQSSLQVKVAPLGFQIAFTGTNKRVYRSQNINGPRTFLRVDNSLDPVYTTTYAKYAKVTIAEAMTDIDTFGSGGRAPYDVSSPTKNEVGTGSGVSAVNGWYKWIYAMYSTADYSGDGGAVTKSWQIVGDDRGFYLFNRLDNSYWNTQYAFQEIVSFKSGDAYPTMLAAHDANYPANGAWKNYPDDRCNLDRTGDSVGKVMMRNYTQAGNYINVWTQTMNFSNSQLVSGRTGNVPWPNGPDFSLILTPVYIMEPGGHVRGQLPGMYYTPHNQPYPHLSIVQNVTQLPGRKFLVIASNYSSEGGTPRVFFDITGPWR
jgi:hypothetical protein